MSGLRVGVVGAGEMGRLHARTVADAARRGAGCRLVGIADHHPGRAARAAREYGGEGLEELEALVGRVDAMIVAVPTSAHFELGCSLLERGLDLLVEKPLAESVEQGERLLELARRHERILQVGHVEWYNPAWREAARRVGPIERIEVERLGPASDRGRDVDVVQDLMLHDLDWVSRLLGGEIEEIRAGGRRGPQQRLDEVEARLRFRSGARARLLASRVHPERRRIARLEGRDAIAIADLLARTVEVTARAGARGSATEAPAGRAAEGEPPEARAALDPLAAQWQDFLEAVASRKQPVNGGEVGVAALRLVERVRSAVPPGAAGAERDDDTRLCG